MSGKLRISPSVEYQRPQLCGEALGYVGEARKRRVPKCDEHGAMNEQAFAKMLPDGIAVSSINGLCGELQLHERANRSPARLQQVAVPAATDTVNAGREHHR